MLAVEGAGAGRAAAEIVGMGNDWHSLGALVCRINIGNKFLRVGNGHGAAVYGQRNKALIISDIADPSVTAQVNCDRTVGDHNIFIKRSRRKGYRTADGCGGVNCDLQ